MNGELPSDLHWLSASEAATAIARKQISPVELTQALLARIDRLDPRLNAFIKVDGDAALAEYRDDVRAAAMQAADVAAKIKAPASPAAEPWPPMRAGRGL